MKTNISKGGRSRDEFADPYINEGKDKDGKPIKICRFCGHQFSIETSITSIKAHLGKVEKQDVILCTKVPLDVEEAARNSMSRSSGKRLNTSITSNSDMQQPLLEECCTSNHPPPQTIELAQEQCPMLLDGSLQQRNVDVQLNPPLADSMQQPPPQRWLASASPPPQNMLLDNSMLNFSEDDLQLLSTILNDLPVNSMNEMTFDIPQPNDSCPMLGVLASQHGSEDDLQLLSTILNDSPVSGMNEMTFDIPQPNDSCPMLGVLASQHVSEDDLQLLSTILNDSPVSGMNEMTFDIPQPNDSCPMLGVLASQHPMQHQREFSNCSPYQDAPRRDSGNDTTTSQDVLPGGVVYPNSLPHSTFQEAMLIDVFDDHEDPKSQHHIQENLQEDERISSSDYDPYSSTVPRLDHMHIVQSLESLTAPICASNQSKRGNKRKLPNESKPIGKKLPCVSKFQGPTFNEKVDEIVKYLEDDSIGRIGVYGMGGSGKTTIMKHIHNQLLEEYIIPFTHVIWVTVYQNHTISKLQQHLASWLDLTLPHNGDKEEWAATINEEMQNMRYALILDDVWDDINLKEVGIPEPSQENKCKLMLTTRSRDVCDKMGCNRAILLNLLSKGEAKELFVKTLGDTSKDLTIRSIMKEVIKKCACLPLAIVVIARVMRGKSSVFEWRIALDTLQDGTIDEGRSVIRNLEFSFRNLDKPLQQCLLYCALYPNDILKRNKKKLIEMLITEGAIGSKGSLKSAEDRVQTILRRLENACLLTRDYDGFVMHDLIRDMCLDIVEGRFLVKCHSEFPPDESEFTEVVEKVSLVCSKFREISLNIAPYCLKLSTLLLSYSSLTRISKSFFMGVPRLQVLDLSETSIQELPDSITNLESLNALVLQRCIWLRCLPCLAPLKALKKLDLYESGIEEAPEGLEELVNLTYLDLDGTYIKTLPSLSLRSLVKLQYLKLPDGFRITMRHVEELKNLEVLKAVFANREDFSEYVSSMLKNGQKLFRYKVNAEFTCVGVSCASMQGTITITNHGDIFQSPSHDFSGDGGEERVKAFLRLDHLYNTRGENFFIL